MLLARFGVLLALPLFAACATLQEVTFDNGLKVVVKEDHRAPVVVSQIWYKVGASDEPDGITGISHVLEHMMFKGTQRHPDGSFSRIIAENGGRENAFTGADYTAYFQTLGKSRLETAFRLEADRMQNLVLDEKEFAKEIRVVMEERRLRTDDRPESLAYEKFMATAFTTHSYKNPIIGWMRDLEKMTVEDVRAWYRRWYVPNNATLVVVGDVKTADVMALARKYFGPIPRRPVERVNIPAEPAQTASRRSGLKAPAQVPTLLVGFHVPAFGTALDAGAAWEPYALQVLSGVLDGGNSARFQRELVRGTEIAASVGTSYNPVARHPVLFVVSGTPSQGQKVEVLQAAVREQIRRLQREPVSETELSRIKAQVTSSSVFIRDSVFYQAMQMGMLETVGLDWKLLDRYPERIMAVTPAQVQAVARKYLTENNMTVTVLEPQPGQRSLPAARPSGDPHGR